MLAFFFELCIIVCIKGENMMEILNSLTIVYIIFYLVVLWKFAVKTGRPGWSLYIPIYSNFVWCSIAGMDIVWCILSIAPSIVTYMYPGNIGILILSSIFSMIISFCFCHSLANRFNKGIWYAIGLFLFNPIFLAILALNKKCIYRGW